MSTRFFDKLAGDFRSVVTDVEELLKPDFDTSEAQF